MATTKKPTRKPKPKRSPKSSFAKTKANAIFSSKPNGREKEFRESIYWGVNKPYADIKDCSSAGIKIDRKKISAGGVYYYITKAQCEKLINWLIK